jgi:cyclase
MTIARRVIPCLDLDRGRVVKSVQFVDTRDAGDPIELAIRYDEQGADELCFLDITATPEGRETTYAVLRAAAERVFIPLTIGGGVRSVDDVRRRLRAGADKVSMNSAALADPALITAVAKLAGSQSAMIAIDARARGPGWEVRSHGGTRPTGRDAIEWAREAVDRGAGEILLTSMDHDGVGRGFALPLLEAICAAVPVPVIASGGAGTAEHFADAFAAGASAALAASVFHFGTLSVAQVKAACAARGFPMRVTDEGPGEPEEML